MSQIICTICGNSFEASRADAQYCSSTCRSKQARATDKIATDKPATVKAPSGRIRPVCQICPVCLYPDWKGELMYPEDEHGVPYCNSQGPLSDTNREILGRKPVEITSKKAAQTGPYA